MKKVIVIENTVPPARCATTFKDFHTSWYYGIISGTLYHHTYLDLEEEDYFFPTLTCFWQDGRLWGRMKAGTLLKIDVENRPCIIFPDGEVRIELAVGDVLYEVTSQPPKKANTKIVLAETMDEEDEIQYMMFMGVKNYKKFLYKKKQK